MWRSVDTVSREFIFLDLVPVGLFQAYVLYALSSHIYYIEGCLALPIHSFIISQWFFILLIAGPSIRLILPPAALPHTLVNIHEYFSWQSANGDSNKVSPCSWGIQFERSRRGV
jgi:hypothetical protein